VFNRGEPRSARICGVPPALGSLCPASGWFVYGDMSSFFEPSGSLLNCHEWFPIAFPLTLGKGSLILHKNGLKNVSTLGEHYRYALNLKKGTFSRKICYRTIEESIRLQNQKLLGIFPRERGTKNHFFTAVAKVDTESRSSPK
jgi:hypothetical protein